MPAAAPPTSAGTITSIDPFVPITEDCTRRRTSTPMHAVSNEDPPACTADDNDVVGTILVEEEPDQRRHRTEDQLHRHRGHLHLR